MKELCCFFSVLDKCMYKFIWCKVTILGEDRFEMGILISLSDSLESLQLSPILLERLSAAGGRGGS